MYVCIRMSIYICINTCNKLLAGMLCPCNNIVYLYIKLIDVALQTRAESWFWRSLFQVVPHVWSTDHGQV